MNNQVKKARKTKFRYGRSSPSYTTLISLIVCVIFAIAGIGIGIIENSLTILVNGLLWGVDILGTLFILSALNSIVKSPDSVIDKGISRFESLATVIKTLLITLIGVYIIIEHVAFPGNVIYINNYLLLISFSIISLFTIRFVSNIQKRTSERYHLRILEKDSISWRTDSNIEIIIIGSLVIGGFVRESLSLEATKFVDMISAFAIILYTAKRPFFKFREALNLLLDKTVSEKLQYDILAIITENFENVCEYKTFRFRREQNGLTAEIDVVLPMDITIEKKFEIEKSISDEIKKLYPEVNLRLYVQPCDNDCLYLKNNTCPYTFSDPLNKENKNDKTDKEK